MPPYLVELMHESTMMREPLEQQFSNSQQNVDWAQICRLDTTLNIVLSY